NLAGTTGGGAIDASGTGTLVFSSAFTATGAGIKTLTLQGTGNGTVQGAIVNNSGTNTTAVTKTGTGTWTFSAVSSYTGGTTVSAGTLKNGINSALAGTGALTVNGTGTYDLAGFIQTVISLSDGGVSTGTVTDSGAAATFDVDNTGTNTFSGVLSG